MTPEQWMYLELLPRATLDDRVKHQRQKELLEGTDYRLQIGDVRRLLLANGDVLLGVVYDSRNPRFALVHVVLLKEDGIRVFPQEDVLVPHVPSNWMHFITSTTG